MSPIERFRQKAKERAERLAAASYFDRHAAVPIVFVATVITLIVMMFWPPLWALVVYVVVITVLSKYERWRIKRRLQQTSPADSP